MRFLIALVPAILAASVSAQTHVVVTSRDGACKQGTLRAEGDGSAVTHPWNSGAPVTLDSEHAWRVSVAADGCWARETSIAAHQGEARIDVWRAAQLRGTIAAAKPPHSLELRIQSPPEAPKLSEVKLTCPIEQGAFDCTVPATWLDIRLAADGFIPQYHWAVQPPFEFGKIKLARGASVSGWVTIDAKGAKLKGVEVTLMPEGAVELGPGEERMEVRRQSVKVNDRGFFQFTGVAPDTYSIRAAKDGWSPALQSDIRVGEGKEHVVRGTLTLQPLAKLAIRVQPAVAPDGKPWNVKLSQIVPFGRGFTDYRAESAASDIGEWQRGGLIAATYLLEVRDAAGAAFDARQVDVSPGMPPLEIITNAIGVEGLLTVGGKPLAAEIELRNGGNNSAGFVSDQEGKFHGAIAMEGKWDVEVRPAGTRQRLYLRDFRVRRKADQNVAEVHIALPGGRIRGIVVDEDGKPVEAGVRILGDRGMGSGGWDKSAPDGTFDFTGLEKGIATIWARTSSPNRDSGLIPHDVREDDDQRMTITVRRRTVVRGWVVDAAGRGRAGALVRYTSRAFPTIEEAVTGPDGEFSFGVPYNTASVDATILAPGLPVKLVSLVPGAKPAEIVVGRSWGMLRVLLPRRTPPAPFVRGNGDLTPLFNLLFPADGSGPPRGFVSGGTAIEIEPGTYTVCPDRAPSDRCITQTIPLGGEATFDTRNFWPASAQEGR